MKTIVRIQTTDEERELLAKALGKKGMVSRAEVNEICMNAIGELLKKGRGDVEPDTNNQSNAGDIECGRVGGSDDRLHGGVRQPNNVGPFIPSRGDEPYLYKPKDPELAAACSTVLDGLERLEQRVWIALEENRKNG